MADLVTQQFLDFVLSLPPSSNSQLSDIVSVVQDGVLNIQSLQQILSLFAANLPVMTYRTMVGFNTNFDTVNTISVSPGQAWLPDTSVDYRNGYYVNTGNGSFSYDQTINGANGLDVGIPAIDTWYQLYVIADSFGVNNTAVIGSIQTSLNMVTLPIGYDRIRWIGQYRTDGLAEIIRFQTSGLYNVKNYIWGKNLVILNPGISTIPAMIDISSVWNQNAPYPYGNQFYTYSFTPNNPGDLFHLSGTETNPVTPQLLVSGEVSAVSVTGQGTITNTIGNPFYYVTDGSLILSFIGFEFSI